MKQALLIAGLAAAGEAAIHKMKLQKVPLSEQLVSHHQTGWIGIQQLIKTEKCQYP